MRLRKQEAMMRGQRHVWIVVCADGQVRGYTGLIYAYARRDLTVRRAALLNQPASCACGKPGHRAVRVELPRGRAR